jgi:hypothetical protein
LPELVPIALACWVVATLAAFRRRPGRDAVLASMIGGWAVLPVASFPSAVFGRPLGEVGSMHALAVPTPVLANKATAIGLGCLLGAVAFDWGALRRLRFSRLDLPILAWVVLPVPSTLANGLPVAEGLAQSRYLALAWGVPYLMGRAYLGENESLRRFGLALVLAGLFYAPVCLLEFLAGPFLYGLVYGPHPYQIEGAARFLGYRPLVFLEHGNQLGMWTASAAVAAVWLWRSGRSEAFWGVSGGAQAAALVAVCLFGQSHGAISLAAVALVPLAVPWRRAARTKPVLVAGAGVLLLALAVSTALAASGGAGGLRSQVREAFIGIGKTSFTWRLARSEQHLARVAERPALGWARADWSAAPGHTFVNPVNLGLWLLALGMYGAAGLICLALVLVLPVAEVLKWLPPRSWLNPGCSGVTLAGVLLALNTADAALNAEFLLPMLAAAGGLTRWSQRRYEGG